ncbi:MAG: ImmA/IrrE family metallo-endopeptidase [Candidatus Omnitrophica bacterium]|nr:ImmA/IrrE family metallo-endopeptidase [Candidatus Omnitrophota bacterium]
MRNGEKGELVKLLYGQELRFFAFGEEMEPRKGHDLRLLAYEVLTDLPKEVREWVVQSICFIELWGHGGEFPPSLLRRMRWEKNGKGSSNSRFIALSSRLRREPEAVAKFVIAHEIAHVWLKHDPVVKTPEDERQADAQAAKWGFPPSKERVRYVEEGRRRTERTRRAPRLPRR